MQHLVDSDDSKTSSPNAYTGSPTQVSSAKILWNQMTPRSKAKLKHRLSEEITSSPAQNLLRKAVIRIDRVTTPSSTITSLELKIQDFISRDDNSMKCPNKKKEHLRYRLNTLVILHDSSYLKTQT